MPQYTRNNNARSLITNIYSFFLTTPFFILLITVLIFSKCIASDSNNLVFVQISDVHINDKNPKYSYRDSYLRKMVKFCNQIIKPDFVIDTGDISDYGTRNEWTKYKNIMSHLKCPYYVIPGNHDGYKATLKQWPAYFKDIHFIFSSKGVYFIGINTAKNSEDFPNNIRGTISADEFNWLKNELGKIKPTDSICIFSHHLPVGKRGNRYNIDDKREEVLKLIENYNVPLWASGHYHYFQALNINKTTFLISQSLNKIRKSPHTKLNSQRGLRIYCIHNGIFSTRFIPFDNSVEPLSSNKQISFWPCSVIVNPVSELFYHTRSMKGDDNKIEVRIFYDIDIEKVECYIDEKFIGDMKPKSNNIWDIASPVNFANGKHKIKIITLDKEGKKGIEEITTGTPKQDYIPEYNRTILSGCIK